MDKTETLDRTSEIAKEHLAKIESDEKKALEDKKQAEKKAVKKAKGESKDASSEDSSTEKEKIEGSEDSKEAKNDMQILEAEDKDLSEEEKEKKVSLIKEKEDAKSPEEKLKDWQESTQKRIDGFIGELKAEREGRKQDANKIESLEQIIRNLKGDLEDKGHIDSDNDKRMKSLEEMYAIMAEEDKDLPFAKRREMSDDAIEEFFLEDYSKAAQWIISRDRRREKDSVVSDKKKRMQSDAKKLFEAYPGCDQYKRGSELAKDGKTNEEIVKILMEESPEYKLMMDIMKDNPSLANPDNLDGPALVLKEMNNRKSQSNSKTYTIEEVEKMKEDAAKKERERISSIDVGISSSGGADNKTFSNDPLYKEGLALFIKAGKRKGMDWSEADYQETLKYGKKAREMSPL